MDVFETRLRQELVTTQDTIREKIDWLEKNSHSQPEWWEAQKSLECLLERRNKILEYIPDAGLPT